jgi:hypothetical protein
MSAHTPGQWIRGGDAGNLRVSKIFTVRQAEGEITLPIIAYVSKKENIPLIATAPDLLYALEDLLAAVAAHDGPKSIDELGVIGRAMRAVKKAKGEE